MYLGIDVGTGKLKAAVYDLDGHLVAAAEESSGATVSLAGADFDANEWWDICRRVVRRVTTSAGHSVTAIGIAGQMHGIVLVDARGRPVRDAVLWPDGRAVSMLDQFDGFDARHPGVLGNPIVPGMAGPILAWLAQREPDRLRDAAHAVQPKDWLRMQLCSGAAVTDPSDASATLLYDIGADAWSAAVCAAVGVDPSLLAPMRVSDSVVGELSPGIAADLNLRPGLAVVAGAGDSAAALVGAGIEEPGRALINTGTGGQIMTPITAPASGSGFGPGIHQYRTASTTTRWYAMAAVANIGLALGWVRHVLGYDWDQIYATGESVLESSAGDPMFLPFLTGEREPGLEVAAGAVWSGLLPSHDRDALARSALRGVAFYLGLRARDLLAAADVTSAVISGGAARHTRWVELIATVLGLPLSVATDTHLTVRGAARLAARGMGGDFPDPTVDRTVAPRTDVDVDAPLRSFEEATQRLVRPTG